MERTVPIRSSEEIDLYLRTIYSLLRSTNDVAIRSLEEVHAGTNSTLHTGARESTPDISALTYALSRLPEEIVEVRKVILGQSSDSFITYGCGNVEDWQEVTAKARRRRCFFDGHDQLACYIASRSDIDDVVPCLTALQIEWNKLHNFLNLLPDGLLDTALPSDPDTFAALADHLRITLEELARLHSLLGENFQATLRLIASRRSNLKIQLLSGSLNDYRKATVNWWDNIERQLPEVRNRPIYFVSSNTHSLANLLSGFAGSRREELLAYIRDDVPALYREWQEIVAEDRPGKENFLFFAMKQYLGTQEGCRLVEEQREIERQHGIHRVASVHSFDVEANIIELNKLDACGMDNRITPDCGVDSDEWSFLSRSNALIFNIDYPLGFAAYNLLTKIAENATQIRGIYIMGKAASLNGVRGDVIIPNVVFDEHSRNTFLVDNHFTAGDVSPFLTYGTVLDNQKAVSVLGTFLQNSSIMDVVYREGYTDIEMEAGPYLSGVYELYRPQRHPVNEIINLHHLPFDLGILHYVSDTPFTKGQNLGAGGLSYYGVDSTYAVSLAVLKRIMELEKRYVEAAS